MIPLFHYSNFPLSLSLSLSPHHPITPSPYLFPSFSQSPHHPISPFVFTAPSKTHKPSGRLVWSHLLTSQNRWIPDDRGRCAPFYNRMQKSLWMESPFDGKDNDRFRIQRHMDQY